MADQSSRRYPPQQDAYKQPGPIPQNRRTLVACVRCRKAKRHCNDIPDGQGACERCTRLGEPCVVEPVGSPNPLPPAYPYPKGPYRSADTSSHHGYGSPDSYRRRGASESSTSIPSNMHKQSRHQPPPHGYHPTPPTYGANGFSSQVPDSLPFLPPSGQHQHSPSMFPGTSSAGLPSGGHNQQNYATTYPSQAQQPHGHAVSWPDPSPPSPFHSQPYPSPQSYSHSALPQGQPHSGHGGGYVSPSSEGRHSGSSSGDSWHSSTQGHR